MLDDKLHQCWSGTFQGSVGWPLHVNQIHECAKKMVKKVEGRLLKKEAGPLWQCTFLMM